MHKHYSGHAPGHVRDAALAAFEAFMDWDGEDPEPTVEVEIAYEARQISLTRAWEMVWNCTDIVPGLMFDRLSDHLRRDLDQPPIQRRTNAACARAILEDIKEIRDTA
jgi:SHS2 domain-containing protein